MTSLNPNNEPPTLAQISAQLASPNTRERVLAMIALQKDTISVDAASPLIQQALTDEAVQVRGMAAFYLGIKPTSRSLDQLVNILAADPDYNVRAMAAGALGYLENKQALEALRHAFYEDTSWLVQFSAAIALGNLQDSQAKAILIDALDSQTVLLQEAAIIALGEIGAVDQVERVLGFVSAEDWMIRKRVAEALGNLPCAQSQSALTYLQTDDNAAVAESATLALQRLAELS